VPGRYRVGQTKSAGQGSGVLVHWAKTSSLTVLTCVWRRLSPAEFIFGALALLYTNAIPILADIHRVTHNMDAEELEAAIGLAQVAEKVIPRLIMGYMIGPEYAFSGGSMERPALLRLLEDVEAGRTDCVVVYKVNRLPRSLLDFARIIPAANPSRPQSGEPGARRWGNPY